MALTNKQLLLLILPILLLGAAIFFREALAEQMGYFFDQDSATHRNNSQVQQKIKNYLDIEKNYEKIRDLQKRFTIRQKNTPWAIEKALYMPETKRVKLDEYKLYMTSPKESVAIINHTIVRVGEQIGDATLIKVEKGRVQLLFEQQGKETQWLELFH